MDGATMNEDLAGLPQDVQDLIALREYVDDMRMKKGMIVELLPEPPSHVPGCDDKNGRFAWYRVSEGDGTPVGYFHAVKGVEL